MSATAKGPTVTPADFRRALLAERLRQAAKPLPPGPLSFGQQRLWFLQQLEPSSALYNIPTVARLTGDLDAAGLKDSLNAIVERHEVLRTRFRLVDDEPKQFIEEAASLVLEQSDLRTIPEAERELQARRLVQREINRPFNLAEDLPLRALLLRLAADEHWLVLTFHHIAFDDWSLRIFFRELACFYEQFVHGLSALLPPLPIQYADYAAWQCDRLRGAVLEQQLSYWRTQLSGSPPNLELPTDRPRRPTPTFRGAQQRRELGSGLIAGLRRVAESSEATPFMVTLAAFATLLHRYTRQEDLLIGFPIAGRTRVETQDLLGFFVNTLPVRIPLAGNPKFEELLTRVRQTMLGAYAHQEAPFEKIVEELQPDRSLTHLPFTRVMLVLQNEPLQRMQLGQVGVEFLEAATDTAKFDLTLVVQEAGNGLALCAEYNTDLYDASTIGRWLEHFEILLGGSLERPERRLSELPLLPPAERHLVLNEWNRTERDYPRQRSLNDLFDLQAARTPNALAVSCEEQTLSYGELNARANQLAHYLIRYKVGLETPVAICVERSLNMIVGWLAILKAGGAYVPLDATYPRERLAFMLRDTQAPVLLTQQSLLPSVPRDLAKVICLDSDWELIARESQRNPAPAAGPDNLAYIIYTSGSTGEPKGVAVPHRAVSRLVLNTNYIRLDATDNIAQISNASFDAATFEVWGALLNGARLIGMGREVILAPAQFARELGELNITAMFLTAALFNQLAREAPGAFAKVRTLLAGGEPLDPKWIRSVLNQQPPQRLLNGYGPTENTTFTCCHVISELAPDATQVPIGRPIANTQVYILDQHLNPVPIGMPGEIFTGGDGLARGYWNRPELNASRFIANPFDGGASRLYRTGDLARFLPDGTIECLGRLDHQVKVRGFRIELGEIETVLSRHPGVRDCIVMVRGGGAESRRLVAYVVPGAEPAPNSSDLRGFLAERLPDYMLPAAFVIMPGFPLTPNGKVDRQALPAPDQARPELERQYVSPRDECELRLTRIWESVLGVKPIGIDDKFFDLGGHSLLAVRLTAQVQKAFGKQLRLATIFQAPTIAQLAAILRGEVSESAVTSASSIIELQPQGNRPPLFLVHGAGGGMLWGYANLCRHLGNDQPVYSFKSRGLDGREEFERIEELAAHYVRDLCDFQPAGPYYLGGYCFGGNVAFEMARRLAAQGREIALLALFNCAPPNSGYTRIPWTPPWCLRFLRNLVYWGNYFRQWSPPQRREFFRWKWLLLKKRFARLVGPTAHKLARVEAGDLVDLSSFTPEQRRVWESHLRALVRFQPKPFAGRVELFRSPGHPLWCSFEPDYGWGALAKGGVNISVVPGAHEKILEEPCVEVLARTLNGVLARAQKSARRIPAATTERLPASRARQGAAPSTDKPGVNSEANAHGRLEASLAYWKQRLNGVPALLELPLDFLRPPKLPPIAGVHSFTVPHSLMATVESLARAQGESPSTVLLAAFAGLLQRHTGRADIIMGADLHAGEVTFPLRCDLSENRNFCTVVNRLGAAVAEAQVAGLVPLEQLIEHLQPERNLSYAPIFQVVFSYQDGSLVKRSPHSSQSTAPSDTRKDKGTLSLDLVLHLKKTGDSLSGRLEYNTALFEGGRIERMTGQFLTLLEAGVATPERKISLLPLLPAKELDLLASWNNTAWEYPRQKTLIEMVAEQVARAPEAVALIAGSERLTYRQLYQRAEQLAQRLQALGVARGDLVGICLARSADMVAGLLATWLAGAAYVPLDPAYPRERLTFMLEDARVKVLLTQHSIVATVPATETQVLLVEDVPEESPRLKDAGFSGRRPQPNDLAYVIYTSGSTGKPKGVALEHRSAVAFACWARQVFADEELAGVLASTSICFDLSIFELFVPLCWGGKIILAENALALANLPAAQEVRLINTVPSAIREMIRVKGVPTSVRVVNLAGEPLPAELVDQIYSKTAVQKVYDLYGPTEATTYSTCALRRPGAPATIGRPLANEQVLILDSQLQLTPIGVPGELYIGGEGLARGYLNRPELTAERFISHPFKTGERLYKTGDLARWRSDGQIEYLGRLDQQVKIRGFRIELGEIESVLKRHPTIREAIVTAREDTDGDKRLVGYVTLQPGQTADSADLRAAARQSLPEYMIPSVFVFLDALPLTPNGKIDRKALPAPNFDRSASSTEFTPPRTELEEKIASLWRKILGVSKVSIEDDFFDLGGHSLLATRLVSCMADEIGTELPLETVFAAPTLAAMCEQVAAASQAPHTPVHTPLRPVPRTGNHPLAFVQERLWFLDQLNPGGHAYHVPIALRIRGPLNVPALQQAVQQIIQRHETLRATFKSEPTGLVQVIAGDLKLHLNVHAFDGAKPGHAEARAKVWAIELAQQPFDLANGPLLRIGLARLNPSDHIFMLVLHHIISDGWSLAVFLEELGTLYQSFASGRPAAPLPQLAAGYIDYVHWQRELMAGGRLEHDLSYWREKLSGAPQRVELPVDKPEQPTPGDHAARLSLRINPALARALFGPGRPEGCTPFMLLLAGLNLTLQKWTGQNDLVIGTVMAGRTRSELEKLIGCFMNFVPLRCKLAGLETSRDLLRHVRATVLEGQTHQDCPFEKVVEAINPERRLNRNPLYNVALLLQNFPPEIFRSETLKATPIPVSLETALLDLRFEVERAPASGLAQAQGQAALSGSGTESQNGTSLKRSASDSRIQANDGAHSSGTSASVQGNGSRSHVSSNGGSSNQEPSHSGASDYVLTCEYRTDSFDPGTIQELLRSCVQVVEQILFRPQARLADFTISVELQRQLRKARSRAASQTVAVTATFTAEPLAEPLRYWLNELGLSAKLEFAPYNQIFQQLLNPASLLAGNASGLNLVLVRLEDWHPEHLKNCLTAETLEAALKRNADEFVRALKAAAAQGAAPYLVCLCPPSAPLAGDGDCARLIKQTESSLKSSLEDLSGVWVLTSSQLADWYPVVDYFDPSGEELGHVPYTARFFTALATAIARRFHSLQRPACKVIVLDCDQTLWAGVCGEDGPNGIRLEPPYLALQRFMRAQHDAGRLLCLCSKNNETDVLEVFARRLEMPLRREHFAAWRLNWLSKSEDLKSLAGELGLGLDSFVFLDDNPVECAEVEANCPEVLTLQLPSDPARIPQFLEHCWVFDSLKLTAEDRRRTELYRANLERERSRHSAPGLAEFLGSLNLQVRIEPISDSQVARVAQLTQRTNQFNCTTRRLNEADVQLLRSKSQILAVHVIDRFGDYGLVGVITATTEGRRFAVDSFMLSCRVLGRGVEHRILRRLGELARTQGARCVDINFVPTARNNPARDFLDSVGRDFKQPLNGGYLYRLPVTMASRAEFHPAKESPGPSAQTAAPQTSVAPPQKPFEKFARCGVIALETMEFERLHEKIESATAPRPPGSRAEYVAPATDLQRDLCQLWQKLLKLEHVGIHDNFFELGGHSLLAVRLFAEIEKLVGRRFPLVTLFQAPTIAELAVVFGERESCALHPLLVPLQTGGTRPPLFLVHGAGGDVLWGYANLVAHLPADQPIYGIKSRGQIGLEEPSSVCDMAAAYLEAVRSLQPQGPFCLGGYCFGGNVAYEMARQLEQVGQEVALVALLDSAPANAGYEQVAWWRPDFAWRFASNLALWLKDFAALPPAECRSFVARKLRWLGRKLKRRFRLHRGSAPVDLEEVIDTTHFPEAELKLWRIHLQALVEHVEQPFNGQVTLLRTRGQPLFCSYADDFCWGKLACQGVVLRPIPGSHENIFMEPNVKRLATILADTLASAQTKKNGSINVKPLTPQRLCCS